MNLNCRCSGGHFTSRPKDINWRQNKNLIVMKKSFFPIIYLSAFLLVGCGKAVDTVNVPNEYKNTTGAIDSMANEIVNRIEKIIGYTEPVFWKKPEFVAVFAIFISILACFISVLAYVWTKKGALWQEQAEINTRAIRQIQKEQQGFILFDFIRHLYRNKVIISALQWQLEGKYNTHYPSDEHILKLQIPLEELELDRFADSSNSFNDLHKLKILCRNTNIEVEVAYEHLKIKDFPVDRKKYDLETLEFKCQLLTESIIQLMYDLNLFNDERRVEEINTKENDILPDCKIEKVEGYFKGKDHVDEKKEYIKKIRTLLYEEIAKNNEKESIKFEDYYDGKYDYRKEEDNYKEEKKEYLRRGGKIYYDDILHISTQLNYDIYMEGEGKYNGKGVIRLIRFSNGQKKINRLNTLNLI